MTAPTTRASRAPSPAVSSLQAAHDVFGAQPRDVLFHIDTATDGLSWCESLFLAIETLQKSGGGSAHIKHLASVGYYIAETIGANVTSSSDEMECCINAAEADGVQA